MFEDVREDAAAKGDAGVPSSAEDASLPQEDQATSPDAESFGSGTTEVEGVPRTDSQDYKDRWLRAEADLQNFRRRAVRDREESVRMAEDRLLLELIGLLDDLERAIAALTPEQSVEAWVQGVVLTASRMRDSLSRHGVMVVPSVGQPFDPTVHEALLEIDPPTGVAPGAIVQEVQKGYRRGERSLRAARVVVARMQAGG
ncbi:MAG: nucleotide exchange factor GrpE [Candidatus Eisenbacteria bacterium]